MKPQHLSQRQHPLFSPIALIATFLLLTFLGLTLRRTGGQAFSPGGLSAMAVRQQMSGGFPHHAAFGDDCTYCHEPFGGVTAVLCEQCHITIGQQRQQQTGLHGQLTTDECALCHQEHQGADHDLFAAAFTHFNDDHHALLFALEGTHQTLDCIDCHQNEQFVDTPHQCIGCHREPIMHQDLFGIDCVRCHTPHSWQPAQLTQHLFPLDHGPETPIPCATCHEATFTAYDCTDCHRYSTMIEVHEDEVMSATDLINCIDCHPTGLK